MRENEKITNFARLFDSMRFAYKIFRMLIVSVLVLAVLIPMLVYITVSLPPVQNKMRVIAEKELSTLLGTKVSIGALSIIPFNNASLSDVTITDCHGDTALYAKQIAAGLDMQQLFIKNRISVSYAVIRGLEAHISRDSANTPLNIQNIIDALKPKDKNKPPTRFDFTANTIILRQWNLTYDVNSEPRLIDRFDPNHISVTNLRADIQMPIIKNEDFAIDLRRLAFEERSGLTVTNLTGLFHISGKGISIRRVVAEMPATRIALGDLNIDCDGFDNLKSRLSTMPLSLKIVDGSYITPSDVAAFIPALTHFDSTLNLDIDAQGSMKRIDLYRCRIGDPGQVTYINIEGFAKNILNRDSLSIMVPQFTLKAAGPDIAVITEAFTTVTPAAKTNLQRMGQVNVSGTLDGTLDNLSASIEASADQGDLTIDADYSNDKSGRKHVAANISTSGIKLGEILNRRDIGSIAASITTEATFNGKRRTVDLDADVSSFSFRGYDYESIRLVSSLVDDVAEIELTVNDPAAGVSIAGSVDIDKRHPGVSLSAFVNDLDLSRLNLWDKYHGYKLNAELNADISGNSIENATGYVSVKNLSFLNSENSGLTVDDITLNAHNDDNPKRMELSSDFIDCAITGRYHFATIWPQLKEILTHSFPVLVEDRQPADVKRRIPLKIPDNDFSFTATLKENTELSKLGKLPFTILAPVEIQGYVNHSAQQLELNVDAPYIQQKDKLIENSAVYAKIDGTADKCDLYVTTQIPTKNGAMPLVLECHGNENRLDTKLNWEIDRKRVYKGDVSLSTLLSRDVDRQLIAGIDVNESRLVFNDSVWTVHPSKIFYRPKDIEVIDFNVSRANQHVKIDGYASQNENEQMTVELLNVNLDYIFESLGLDNVMIGGDATGSIVAAGAFSPQPRLLTDNLTVTDISYNKAVLGNADIKSHWDNERKAVSIDALISQPNDATSHIYGDIFALNDSLDMHFDANQVDVRFMAPFMAAFASDISGYASGKARLWGNFKYIDFEGAVLAQDLKLKIDFTNAVYTATDSIRFTPGRISLNDVMLIDQYGHTALLNGAVTHKFFKEPSFNFQITNAEDILVYNVTQRLNPDWYGQIFGSGTAWIKGSPGIINIGADMTTGPKSTFTFVLSDRQEASEYSFITFRDKTLMARQDSIEALDTTPEAVKRFKKSRTMMDEASSSVYNLNFDVNVTPDMKIILIMDPDGGDQVTAYGNGNLHMGYDSSDENLVMRGIYTVERGTYNFTLQDIIIRDFTINPGSSISFHGSPYNANLDITAVYSTNANLSDLDESFLQDKELNRTNVPVQALLKVNGDMRTPDLSFDLRFPTLTNDTYRKVRSIVSTEEMMNRQIIYLLALNRFYTPDYMASTTKGNELVSVASSTISSQLSNILGHLSDNWSIAPNVRSDRGDFSDVEVDLALSSQLLNNRLIFNGNLGYRDKSLNTNQFVGDFDIEYLLNRSGNVRLKAYNRYNDQNFYIKTATTTQGIGIMFRRDFDRMFGFLRHRKKPKPIVKDTIPAVDSILNDSMLRLPADK